jgi:hypothetical protein
MPATSPHDDLEDYLRGDSALSRQYRREPAPAPPHALDRRILGLSRGVQDKSPCLAPLAFAASVLLSVALVLAIVFGPQTARRADEAPHLVKVAARADASPNVALNRKQRLYSSDPHVRRPAAWLADIAALRRAGRYDEADAEIRRFRSAYPDYSTGEIAIRP